LDLLQDTAQKANGVVSHDWWAYQLITGAGGTVCYDRTPTVLYRQHSGNLIGANDTLLASAARLARLFKGQYQNWNDANTIALGQVRRWLTPEAKASLDQFCRARTGGMWARLTGLNRAGVHRQTLRGTAALWLAAFFNRL
ncbi:glycosyltransferase family 2 protein, partial [Rhodobacteraceae bacterium]|nr:glycosyltransferase family 2 protein [Paracoccaceae bacterium]